MKASRLAAALTITLLPCLASAADYQGNLVLASQSAVNAASVYTGVTGSLTISGADIVDLSPLAGFTQVGGEFFMQGNPSLTQASGIFPSLTNVGGGMWFYDNDSLLELSGFDALLQTGDNIDFWFNDLLTSVSGFGSLHTVGWSLEFGDNPKLVEIPEFLSLQTISSSLFVLDNDSLPAITGFGALTYVDWSFQIVNNKNLNSLCGLYNYFVQNNPYTGNGAFDIRDNGPGLPNPTTEQHVIDAGPCTFGIPYCFGDVGSCPCGNGGGVGEGCQNSSGLGGRVFTTGSPSILANDLGFDAVQLPAGVPCLLFTGDVSVNLVFGDGIRCAGGSIKRLGVRISSGLGQASWAPSLAAAGGWVSGDTRYFQVWFRDPNGPCGAAFNVTNAMQVDFIP